MRPAFQNRLADLVERAIEASGPERRALADAVLDLLVSETLGGVPTEREPFPAAAASSGPPTERAPWARSASRRAHPDPWEPLAGSARGA